MNRTAEEGCFSGPGCRTSMERFLQRRKAGREGVIMFAFYSNRLGCLGSILLSIALSLLLFALLHGCQTLP
jgi:hypothetical protein